MEGGGIKGNNNDIIFHLSLIERKKASGSLSTHRTFQPGPQACRLYTSGCQYENLKRTSREGVIVVRQINCSLHAENEYKQSNLKIELASTQINQGQLYPTSSAEQTIVLRLYFQGC